MNTPKRIKNRYAYSIPEKPGVRQRIIENNRKYFMSQIAVPNRFVNLRVEVNIPEFYSMNFQIKNFVSRIPKPPHQVANKPSFPFYHRTFRFVYFLIGITDDPTWEIFKKVYEQIVTENHRPLHNLHSLDHLQQMISDLNCFIDSGMQVRILISVQNVKQLRDIQQKIKQIYEKPQVIQIIIQQIQSSLGSLSSNKFRVVKSIEHLLKQNQQIQRLIKKSTKSRQTIQYNFVNLQANSSQAFHRKNLVQQCLQPKDNPSYRKTFKKFRQMMEGYQNVNQLNDIDRYRQQATLKTSSKNINQQIKKCWDKIEEIQKIQKKFCQQFQKYLQKDDELIQQREDYQNILFILIQEYIKQNSIYEVINSNLRLSISVNQQKIQCLSVIIKYLFEAVQQFFFRHKKMYQFKKTNDPEIIKQIPYLKKFGNNTQVLFRGFRISKEQLRSLKTGSIVRNLGFMSTSRSAKQAKFYQGKNYLLVLLMGQFYKQTDNDQEGFIDMEVLFKQQKMELANSQEEVLFNPLNVFEVVQVLDNENDRMIILKYAPHIELFNSIKKGTAKKEDHQKYRMIKSNITSLNRSNYDKGKMLMIKGSKKQALQYYENAERVGETLTTSQKFNKLQILKQNKDYRQIEQDLAKMAKNYETEVKQLQNLDNQKNQTNKIQKVSKILNLTRQSQILQSTTKFFQAEKRASLASTTTKALTEQQMKSKETITSGQFIETLTLDIRSTLQLAKSRYQTNDIGDSIWDSYTGFKNVDRIYKHCEQFMIPKIQKLCKNLKITLEMQKYKNLIKIIEMDDKMIKKDRKDSQIAKQLADKKKQQQEIEKLRKTLKKSGVQIEKDRYEQIKQYFKNRKKYEMMFKVFYPACQQIQQLENSTRQNKNTINLVKKSLTQFKQNMDQLFQYEQQLYDIIKLNFKVTNTDIKPCLIDEKNNYYGRFSRYSKARQSIQLSMKNQINTQEIKSYNRYASFLLQFADIEDNQQQKKAAKKEGFDILDALSLGVSKVQRKSVLQDTPSTFTNEKALIINTQICEYKNSCLDQQIIERASVMMRSSKKSNPIKTISACKNREDFQKLKDKLQYLQRIHQSDNQINKVQHLLLDVNSQLDLLNNSFSISKSPDQYNQFLAEANRKIQVFNQKFVKNGKLIINQQFIEYKYLQSQNKLRRGYFKESQKILLEAQKNFEQIYSDQQLGQKGKSEKRYKINKLYARDLPIKCFRLKAEIIGVYGKPQEKGRALEQLNKINELIKNQAPQKVVASALVNEAFVFIAMKCMPKKISRRSDLLQRFDQSLAQSIMIRQAQLGTDNQFLAVAYSYYVNIYCRDQKADMDKLKQCYKKGKVIFDNLSAPISKNQSITYLDKQPMLYLYKMQMQTSYLKIIQKDETKIANSFKDNIQKFNKNRYGAMSLQITDNYMIAGSYLSSIKKYKEKGQQYLKKSEQEVEELGKMNQVHKDQSNGGAKALLQKIKYSLFKNLADHYQRYGDTQKSSQYGLKAQRYKPPVSQKKNNYQQQQVQPQNLTFLSYTLNMILGCTQPNLINQQRMMRRNQ